MRQLVLTAVLAVSVFGSETQITNPDWSGDTSGNPLFPIVCGDYDGDGSDDVLLLSGYTTVNPQVERFTVFSYAKKEVLLSIRTSRLEEVYTPNFAFGDLDNDNDIEIVYKGTVYNYDNGVTTSGN